jgi:hypothetical protein
VSLTSFCAPSDDISASESFAFFFGKDLYPCAGALKAVCGAHPGLASQTSRNGPSARSLYRFLPFARSTYRHAAAIIAAVSTSAPSLLRIVTSCSSFRRTALIVRVSLTRAAGPRRKLQLIFVGGFVRGRLATSVCARPPPLRNGALTSPLLAMALSGRVWSNSRDPWNREGCHVLWLARPRRSPQAAKLRGCRVLPPFASGGGVVLKGSRPAPCL